MRLSNKPFLRSGLLGSASSPTNALYMLGGFGASGGVTAGQLLGRIEAGWGAGTKKLSFNGPEVVPDLPFVLLEEDGDDGSDEAALVDLGSISIQQSSVDDGEVGCEQLPAALRHGNPMSHLGQLHSSGVHLPPLLF